MEGRHIINIVKYRWVWMGLTTILLLPCLISMIYAATINPNHSPLKLGIDYTGGTILQYSVDQKVDNNKLADLRTNLVNAGVDSPALQIINVSDDKKSKTKDIISIRTKFIEGMDKENVVSNVTSVMQKEYKNSELLSTNSIGPTLGKELFKNSLIALGLACLGIVAYLSFRFQFDFAVCAILALMHDVVFVVGVFALLGLFCGVQVDGLFLTAILTVIGFSVHDTIVVFDRIRENLRYYAKKMSFGEIVNASVTQTMARSINTSLTTLITLMALYFFGGVTTRDFVLAMILGIAIGTYSSIFFASMLIDFWRDKKAQPKRA